MAYADDFQRMDEAEAVRVELLVQCGLVHQSTDYVMGNEQGIQFLDHADRFQAAEGAARRRWWVSISSITSSISQRSW
jgi:hypothetical protein